MTRVKWRHDDAPMTPPDRAPWCRATSDSHTTSTTSYIVHCTLYLLRVLVAGEEERLVAARAPDAVPGCWVSAVRSLMLRYGIKFGVPPCDAVPGNLLRTFRRQVVLPTLVLHHDGRQNGCVLPWGWIGAQGDSAFSRRSFEVWWHLRVLGSLEYFAAAGFPRDRSVLPEWRRRDARSATTRRRRAAATAIACAVRRDRTHRTCFRGTRDDMAHTDRGS